MKRSTILVLVAVAFLVINAADIISTWIVISSGKGVEADPMVLALGGPFSPLSLFVKVALVPVAILGVAWWLVRRFKDPRLGVVTILPSLVPIVAAVANNVIVASKKVRKIAHARQR